MSGLIQFLTFEGCPLAEEAWNRLQKALAEPGSVHVYKVEQVDLMSPDTPGRLHDWGSPTFLVDGKDIFGGSPGDASGCRIYSGPGGLPTAKQIAARLRLGVHN